MRLAQITVVFLFAISWRNLNAQCDSTVVIDDQNINELSSPYELSFLNKPAKTQLDKYVAILISSQDTTEIKKTIAAIGALKTDDSYCFLFTMCCRPIIVKDLNPFNRLSSVVVYYGGYKALNTHHLDGAINQNLPFVQFAGEVYSKCREKTPICHSCLSTQ